MEQLYPRETSQITPSPGRVPQLSGRASAAISHNNTRKIHRLCIGWWVTVSVCSSWFQDCAPIPVGGVSRVPDGEWPQHRQLTAIPHNIADLVILFFQERESRYFHLAILNSFHQTKPEWRTKFALGRWVIRGKKKSTRKHAKCSGKLFRIFSVQYNGRSDHFSLRFN